MAKVVLAGAFWCAASTAPEGQGLVGSPWLSASSQPHTNTALIAQELSTGMGVGKHQDLLSHTCGNVFFLPSRLYSLPG